MNRRSFFGTLCASLIVPFLHKPKRAGFVGYSIPGEILLNARHKLKQKSNTNYIDPETIKKLRKILYEYNDGGMIDIVWGYTNV